MKWHISFSLALLFSASQIYATTIDFSCISSNSASNCTTGEAQLSVDVINLGDSQVQFNFFNTGPDMSSIRAVYFDSSTSMASISSLIDSDDGINGHTGVDFSVGTTQSNVPRVNNTSPPLTFEITPNFLADADPSPSKMPPLTTGINPGEWLGVIFDLKNGVTFADILAELNGGDLRIGMYVVSFADGGGENFINQIVPIPATLWFLTSGILGLLVLRKPSN